MSKPSINELNYSITQDKKRGTTNKAENIWSPVKTQWQNDPLLHGGSKKADLSLLIVGKWKRCLRQKVVPTQSDRLTLSLMFRRNLSGWPKPLTQSALGDTLCHSGWSHNYTRLRSIRRGGGHAPDLDSLDWCLLRIVCSVPREAWVMGSIPDLFQAFPELTQELEVIEKRWITIFQS